LRGSDALPSLESGIVVTNTGAVGQASYNSNTAEPADPSFTKVSSGWGGYSASAYLYAMSHANGPSTVIQSLGKLPGTYTDPIYFLRTHGTYLRGD
jgi:hypothetical protein